MKRLLVACTLVAAVFVPSAVSAPTAGTGTLRGIVIAKDAHRHAVVVARPGGVAQMLIAPASAFRVGVGRTVVVRYQSRPGRLPIARSITLKGHARHVVVRGTVVRLLRQRALLNAGGSLLGLTLRPQARQRALASSQSGPHAGDDVKVDVEIDDDGSLGDATLLDSSPGDTGQDDSGGEMEVHGTVSALTAATTTAAGSITVTVHGLAVTCVIPAGAQVTAAVGGSVEIECELVGDPAVWTLRNSGDDDESEHAEGGHHHNGHDDHGDDDDDGGDDD
jgi:hypothetical protein